MGPHGASLFIFFVCDAVGLPVGETVALIMSMDWLIDRISTLVNVIGHLLCTVLVCELLGSGGQSKLVEGTAATITPVDVDVDMNDMKMGMDLEVNTGMGRGMCNVPTPTETDKLDDG